MGKGLSPLQRHILKILQRAALHRKHASRWKEPRDLLKALGLAANPNRRTALSRSLRGLHQRGLVMRRRPARDLAGKAYRYKLSRLAMARR